ncbi:hypothetical protein AAE478_010166 [Parahypoxylon ruwenzoriense]
MLENDFVYRPLRDGEIRLLRLRWIPCKHTYSEDVEDVIDCEVTHHSLDSNPIYVSLSYTWGVDPPRRRIRMNGKDMLIRQNLYSFFRQAQSQAHAPVDGNTRDCGITTALKDSERERRADPEPRIAKVETDTYWWIDALCINQFDIPERNVQVAQMRRIYTQARLITIWLGPAADDSDLAMGAYQSYQSHVAELNRELHNPITPGELREHNQKWLDSLPLDPLWKLSQRPWWRRVWVWQEATSPHVPTEFWCGAARVPFDTVYAANDAIGNRKNFLSEGAFPYNSKVYALRQLRASRAGRSATINISPLWLLDEATRLAASDPRDRVYAMLPIWDELQSNNGQRKMNTAIPIDYGRDAEEVFRLATVYILQQSPRRLDILRNCMCNSDGTFRRYSWVPDMSDEMVTRPWSLFVDFFARQQAPIPEFDPRIKFLEDNKIISLHAHPLGFVKRTHSPIASGEEVLTLDPGLWEARYRTWIGRLGEMAYPNFDDRPYVDGSPVSTIVDRLLTFNRIIQGIPVRHWPVLEVANFNFSALPDPQALLRNGPHEFIYGISCLSLIETQDGYLGAALPGTRIGDALVGIPGIPCPVVLRRHEYVWRIVGCAYVVGLSDRKAWGADLEGTEFVIS